MALNKPAWQSSTFDGNGAYRAVDGNDNPAFSAKSCIHTNVEDFPTWAVDLQVMTTVYYIDVMRRDLTSKREHTSIYIHIF